MGLGRPPSWDPPGTPPGPGRPAGKIFREISPGAGPGGAPPGPPRDPPGTPSGTPLGTPFWAPLGRPYIYISLFLRPPVWGSRRVHFAPPRGPPRGGVPPGGQKSAHFFGYLITLPVGTVWALFSDPPGTPPGQGYGVGSVFIGPRHGYGAEPMRSMHRLGPDRWGASLAAGPYRRPYGDWGARGLRRRSSLKAKTEVCAG